MPSNQPALLRHWRALAYCLALTRFSLLVLGAVLVLLLVDHAVFRDFGPHRLAHLRKPLPVLGPVDGVHSGTQNFHAGFSQGAGQVRMQQGFFSIQQTCPACKGAGTTIADPCVDCHGRGRVRKTRTLSVKVPAGVDDGDRIRLSGEGEAGRNGGPPGDLYVEIHVEEDERFQRVGDELHHRVEIGISEAVFGTTVEVPIIDAEPETIDLPAGTQPETVYRLNKKGMPHLRRRGRGDMLVHIGVMIPTDLTDEQSEVL